LVVPAMKAQEMLETIAKIDRLLELGK
jgi:hypothetical protein